MSDVLKFMVVFNPTSGLFELEVGPESCRLPPPVFVALVEGLSEAIRNSTGDGISIGLCNLDSVSFSILVSKIHASRMLEYMELIYESYQALTGGK